MSSLNPIYSYAFDFEENFVYDTSQQWMAENWITAFYWSLGYLLVIFGLKAWMRNRAPFNLRRLLQLWNVALATFSIMGTIRVWPEMAYIFKSHGFISTICQATDAKTARVFGLWVWLFTLSKVVELGDTLFIVLRKQHLMFLHWYHHITVLIFTWYSYPQLISTARWYVDMNYMVHSLMYTYYAFRAFGYKVPRKVAMAVTSSQLLQMVLGGYVSYVAYQKKMAGEQCYISPWTSTLAVVMYGSYFMLFAHFFLKAYTNWAIKTLKPKKIR